MNKYEYSAKSFYELRALCTEMKVNFEEKSWKLQENSRVENQENRDIINNLKKKWKLFYSRRWANWKKFLETQKLLKMMNLVQAGSNPDIII